MPEKIETKKAPEAAGPYSQAVKSAGFVFVSGQLPINPETGKLAEPEIAAQTRQAMENIRAILLEAGASFENAVKIEIFLKDLSDFEKMNGVYAGYFPKEPRPARYCVEVSAIPKGALILVSCIAELPE